MMKIKSTLYHRFLKLMPVVSPETGRILGGNNGIVSELLFDKIEYNEAFASYKSDTRLLNRYILK